MDELMVRMSKVGYGSLDALKSDIQIAAIMILSDAVNIEMNVQIICDLISSKNGTIGKGKEDLRMQHDHQTVDLYVSNADLEYADVFNWPRHGQGILIRALDAIFKENYPHLAQCNIILYGKP